MNGITGSSMPFAYRNLSGSAYMSDNSNSEILFGAMHDPNNLQPLTGKVTVLPTNLSIQESGLFTNANPSEFTLEKVILRPTKLSEAEKKSETKSGLWSLNRYIPRIIGFGVIYSIYEMAKDSIGLTDEDWNDNVNLHKIVLSYANDGVFQVAKFAFFNGFARSSESF